MIKINKTHSKNDLFDLINLVNIPIVFSHSDNKQDLHDKINDILKEPFEIKPNHFGITNIDNLKEFLKNKNPKKTLTVKEKSEVMAIAKHIINYCKNGYELEYSYKYNSHIEIKDDCDYIKAFGDTPSVRRACRLINQDPFFANDKFIPLISPQVKRVLEAKLLTKSVRMNCLKIRRGTPECPVIVVFD
tara:strand:+ start:20 stop:586 length:567 start_codon:yes stop_codon:yes gene_type:complete